MKRSPYFLFLALLLCPAFVVLAQAQPGDSMYMFSYFKGNGEDGLHFASSRDGYHWTAMNGDSSVLKPMVGNEKLMRDPCIIQGRDGYFHMVWTASWKDKGIGYARSKDLINWSEQQFVPVMIDEVKALNCWAPEIIYDKESDQYMIFWATTIPGRFPATDTSGDDMYNHRMYYVTTRDFIHYTKAKILYDQGFNVIDATIVANGKGYLMFLKDETKKPPQKNIRTAYSDNVAGPYTRPSSPITGASYWAEGPTTIRVNNKWVVYFDKYTQHKMGAVQSVDGIHWEDISDQIKFPAGTRHGTVFEISKKQYVALLKSLQVKARLL